MPEATIIPLSAIKSGQEGEVIQIIGGAGVARKLDALGVRSGKKLRRISSASARGPIVFEIDKTQIAVGQGIAQKILVKIKE